MNILLKTVSVRRDAMTTIPVTVPAHEMKIQRLIFGADNVQILSEDAGAVELDPAEEGNRLAQKYGPEAVTRAYGEDFKTDVAEALAKFEVTAKQPKKAAAVPA